MTTDTATHASLPLVAYCRVSTAAQAAIGLGLAAQRRAIQDAAAAQAFEVAGWYKDAGRSGATITRRHGLQAALAEVAVGRAGGLVSKDRPGLWAAGPLTSADWSSARSAKVG